jgi:tRNA (guanine37-N1)-methyltransferase
MSRTKEDELRRKLKNSGSQTTQRILSEGSALETAVPRNRVSAFIMNLPDSAIQFLDAFRGILASDGTHDFRHIYDIMPMVHCYCFTRELELTKAEVDIRSVCALQYSLIYTESPVSEGGSAARICFNR